MTGCHVVESVGVPRAKSHQPMPMGDSDVLYFFNEPPAHVSTGDDWGIEWNHRDETLPFAEETTLPDLAAYNDLAARLTRLENRVSALLATPTEPKQRVKKVAKIACTACRQQHEACSHDTPCQKCKERGLTCSYRPRLPWATRVVLREEEEARQLRVRASGVTKKKHSKKKKRRRTKKKPVLEGRTTG